MAGRLWAVSAAAISQQDSYNYDGEYYGDVHCSSPRSERTCGQIIRKWAVNLIITAVVLTLLAVLVTYFGQNFTIESNRIYFIILLLTLMFMTIAISLIFCKNSAKPTHPHHHKEPSSSNNEMNRNRCAPQERSAEGVVHGKSYCSNSSETRIATDTDDIRTDIV